MLEHDPAEEIEIAKTRRYARQSDNHKYVSFDKSKP